MKAEIGIVMLAVGAAVADMAGECDMAAFYLELGCSPLPPTDNSSSCPDAFACPDHPDPTMCYLRGVAYGHGARIPRAAVNDPCTTSCVCLTSGGGRPRLACADVDCFRGYEEQCVNTNELDSCCVVDYVCGKDEIAKLATCEVDGRTYREGEYFLPKNTRKWCVCAAQFNGSVDDAAYCRDDNCGFEVRNQDHIKDKCAPVFSENRLARTCPLYFICPSPTSKVIRGTNVRSVSARCVFGNATLAVGDEVSPGEGEACTACACAVPPFVSCTKRSSC